MPYPSERKQHLQKALGSSLERRLLTLILLSLVAILVCLLVIGRLWFTTNTPGSHPTPTPIVVLSPQPSPIPSPSPMPSPISSPTLVPTPIPTAILAQRIDSYINHLT